MEVNFKKRTRNYAVCCWTAIISVSFFIVFWFLHAKRKKGKENKAINSLQMENFNPLQDEIAKKPQQQQEETIQKFISAIMFAN